MSSLLPAPGFIAGSTIQPFQIVQMSTAADWTVIPAVVGSSTLGISQGAMNAAPGLAGSDTTIAAVTGQQVNVYGTGNIAQLQVSAAITRGSYVISDANGYGTSIVNHGGSPVEQYVVGIALESASGPGAIIKVWVWNIQISL